MGHVGPHRHHHHHHHQVLGPAPPSDPGGEEEEEEDCASSPVDAQANCAQAVYQSVQRQVPGGGVAPGAPGAAALAHQLQRRLETTEL